MSNPSVDHLHTDISVKKVNMAELYPLMKEVLEAGGSFKLTITGSSMFPFILGGRDQVTLSPLPETLKKNDLPLYRRRDGSFVLHRIVRCEKDGTYTCCGDHQWTLEPGLRHDQMIAIATAYVRKGRELTNQNILYRIYRTVWTWIIPLRPYIFKLLSIWRSRKIFVFRKKRNGKKQ